VDQYVPAFAVGDECDKVQADQIIQQAVLIVGLVHEQVIAQAKHDGVKQEPVNSEALGSPLSEGHEQPQKDIDDIKSDRGHHPDKRWGRCDFRD
jgi:hypothetical protein